MPVQPPEYPASSTPLPDPVAVTELQAIAAPSHRVTDAIWLIIVASFAAIFVGSAAAITIGMFVTSAGGRVAPDSVIAIFLASLSFLAGLLAPSPSRR